MGGCVPKEKSVKNTSKLTISNNETTLKPL